MIACCLVVAQSFSFSPPPLFGFKSSPTLPACRARPSPRSSPVCGDRKSFPASARPSFQNDPARPPRGGASPRQPQGGATNAALKTAAQEAKRDKRLLAEAVRLSEELLATERLDSSGATNAINAFKSTRMQVVPATMAT